MVCHADDKLKEALFSKVFHGFVTGALRIDPKVNPESAREEAIATIFQALVVLLNLLKLRKLLLLSRRL